MSANLLRSWRPENSSQRRRSIPAVLASLDHDVLGKDIVSEDGAAAGGEVGPWNLAWIGRGSRDKIADDFVALADLDMDAGAEPGFDLAGVAELAEGDALHGLNVTQNVTHCQVALSWRRVLAGVMRAAQ